MPAEREVLEPRHDADVRAAHGLLVVAERLLHRPAGECLRIGQVVLAGHVVRRVDHGVDRVQVPAEHLRRLADAEIAGGGKAEEIRRHANAERSQPLARVGEEALDRSRLRLLAAHRIHDRVDIAVAREPDVVELDLVEAGLRRRGGDVDDVSPGALVVRVQPREPRRVAPDGAVGPLQRELRPRRAQRRIGEGDDAADEIDAGLLGGARRCAAVVVEARRPDVVCELRQRLSTRTRPCRSRP